MSYLLDTNVVSEIRRRRPDPGVRAWFAGVAADEVFLSVLVVGEIHRGIESLHRRDPDQASILSAWLDRLRSTYADRILPVTLDVAVTWGGINARRSLPVVDGLLAATALTHRLTLVTRNVADVAGTEVDLLDPFAD